jgi:hypothetical protein
MKMHRLLTTTASLAGFLIVVLSPAVVVAAEESPSPRTAAPIRTSSKTPSIKSPAMLVTMRIRRPKDRAGIAESRSLLKRLQKYQLESGLYRYRLAELIGVSLPSVLSCTKTIYAVEV